MALKYIKNMAGKAALGAMAPFLCAFLFALPAGAVNPPGTIDDLQVAAVVSTGLGASSMTVTLTWSAPDDGDGGNLTSSTFSVRYSTTGPINSDGEFDNASFAIDIPTDTTIGEPQVLYLTGLEAAVTHYFVIKSTDSEQKTSSLSVGATALSYIVVLEGSGSDSLGNAWGDYDGDGLLDIAVANSGSDTYLLHNDGGGAFSKVNVGGSGGNSTALAWGDYDNDGRLDLAVANAGQNEYLLHNDDAAGNFTLTPIGDTAGSAYGIAWGDYDNDGDLDLAVANNGQNNYIARNDGVSFTTITLTGTSEGSFSAAWGDYDRDGDLDLAFANNGTDDEYVMRNDGGDAFTKVVITDSAGDSAALAWGDYDNDGDLDLAVVNLAEDNYIARNDGGSFSTFTVAGTNGTSVSVVWGDHDGDGDLDLAVGNNGGDDYVVRNDGSDVFTPSTLPGTSGFDTNGVSWGDYDGDGDLDLAVSDGSADNYLLRNDTVAVHSAPAAPGGGFSAVFSEYSVFSSSGDLILQWNDGSDAETSAAGLEYLVRIGTNAPGGSDYLPVPDGSAPDGSAGGSQFYSTRLGGGQRGLKAVLQKGTTVYWAVRTVDAESNRSPESAEQSAWLTPPDPVTNLDTAAIVSTGLGASTMSVTLTWTAPGENGGSGSITGGEYDIRYALAPIDSTGAYAGAPYQEVFSTSTSPGALQVHTITGLDSGTSYYFAVTVRDSYGARSGLSNCTTAPQVLTAMTGTTGNSRGAAWGDYDRDGDLDAAVALASNGNVYIMRNDGQDGFVLTPIGSSGGDSRGIAWGDYDNDGDLDLAVANTGISSNTYLLRNDGGGSFMKFEQYDGSLSRGIAWGDYDNDGDLDLAVANFGAANHLLRNDGQDTFTMVGLADGTDNSMGIVFGDYDEDGDLDLAVANATNQDTYFLRNDGNESFSKQGVSSLGDSRGLAFGDYDGDGDLDLAVANNGEAYLLRNDAGTYNALTLVNTGGDSYGVSWGDLDDDGDLDLFLTNNSDNDQVLRYDGGTSFVRGDVANTGGAGYGSSLGDYDGDGSLDVYIANDAQDDQVHRNDAFGAHEPPSAPGSFSASFEEFSTFSTSGTLTLSWGDGSDGRTPAAALEYLVRVGTTVAGSSDVYKVPDRMSFDGYSGGGSFLYSTRLPSDQRGIKLLMQKETTAYWGVVTVDGESLRSAESSAQETRLTAPAAVTDLSPSQDTSIETSSVTWVKLSFDSPGEDGAAGDLQSGAVYDIRWSTSGAIDTEQKYEAASGQYIASAQGSAGVPTTRSVPVAVGETHYFAMTTKDRYGARSPLSNATGGFQGTILRERVTDIASSSELQGQVTGFLKIELWTESGSVQWTGLKLKKTGTLSDAAVEKVAVYADFSPLGVFDANDVPAQRTLNAVFVSSQAELTMQSAQTINTTPKTYFVGVQFSDEYLPVEGATITVSLDGQDAYQFTGGGIDTVEYPAWSFDGTVGRATAPYHPSLNLVTAVTLEAWVRTTDDRTDRAVITQGDASSGYRLWLGGGSCGAGVPSFFVGSQVLCANDSGTPVTVNDGNWHHVAAAYDLSVGKTMFVDGVPLSTGIISGSLSNGTEPLSIGGSNGVVGNSLRGEIDEVRITPFFTRYSTANPFTPELRSSNGGRAHYHFDAVDISSGIILDSSGQGNHLTLQPGATGYAVSVETELLDAQDELVSAAVDISPQSFFPGAQCSQGEGGLLKLELWTEKDFAILEEVSVAPTGTGLASNVTNLKMYGDDGDGVFEPLQDPQLVTGLDFIGGKATFSLVGAGQEQLIGTSTKSYYFCWDVTGGAQIGETMGLSIGGVEDFVLSGSTDVTAAWPLPFQTPLRTIESADTRVLSETPEGYWVNVSSFVFQGNFGTGNVSYFRYAWDQSPGTSVDAADTQWTGGKATMTATTSINPWYFHVRGYDALDNPGTQQDFGPYYYDGASPADSAFLSYNSTDGALAEAGFNDLASDVTAQLTVQDGVSGLSLDGPAPLLPSSATVGLWHFDETSGAVWKDASPYGNHLIVGAGGVTRAAGRFLTGLLFDGTADMRNVAPDGLPTADEARSIEAWVVPLSTEGTGGIASWGPGGLSPMRLSLENGRIAADLGGGYVAAGPVLSTGAYQHVAFTFDGNMGRYYLNGQEVGSNAFGVQNTGDGNLYVGSNDIAEGFVGQLDEIRVLARAMGPGEVLNDYSRGHPFGLSFSKDAGAHWSVVVDTDLASYARIARTGAHGSMSAETVKGFGLELVTSTSTQTGEFGTSLVRFHIADRAGNVLVGGPYTILIDTNAPVAVSTPSLPADGMHVRPNADFAWTGPSSGSVQSMAGSFYLQVDDDPGFSSPDVYIATPAVSYDAEVAQVPGVYLSTFTLTEDTTYYWRVRSRSFLGVFGPWGQAYSFVTDVTSPAGSGFRVYSSSGGLFLEDEPVDLLSGVTVQLAVQDGTAGLSHDSELSAIPGTVGLWHFSETEQGAIADESGTSGAGQFEGTLSSAAYVMTPFGSGVHCDAGEGAAVPGAAMDFAAAADFTIEAWIRPSNVGSARIIAGLGSTDFVAEQNNWILLIQTGNLAFMNNNGLQEANAALVTAQTWQHVAMTARGNRLKFYVNGVLRDDIVSIVGGNSGPVGKPFTFGLGVTDSGLRQGSYSGDIDEVRVLDYAAEAGQIAQDYARTRPGHYSVEYSTDAGWGWRVISATHSVGGLPWLELSGSEGSVAPELLTVRGLDLAHSTSAATGGKGTNQLRFLSADRAGNYAVYGPFAVVIDTVAAAAISTPTVPGSSVYVGEQPNFGWVGPSTAVWQRMGAGADYVLDVDDDPGFNSPEISINRPISFVSTGSFVIQGAYASTFTLAEGTTFYWRIRNRDFLGLYSPPLAVGNFVTDFTDPADSAFAAINSKDAAVPEGTVIDLVNGVTVQLTVQDSVAGLAHASEDGVTAYGVIYTTQGAQGSAVWKDGDWAEAFRDDASPGISAMGVFQGDLVVGLDSAGGVSSFNGSAWSSEPVLPTGTSAQVLTEFQGSLYAGSYMDGRIYSFDGFSWTEAFDTGDSQVNDIKAFRDRLYAATGRFDTDPGRVWSFDPGTGAWYKVFETTIAPSQSSLLALEVHDDLLYAGGYPDIYVFDGSTWTLSYAQSGVTFSDLVSYDGRLFAASNNSGRVYNLTGGVWDSGMQPCASPHCPGVGVYVERMGLHDGRLYASVTDPGWAPRILTYDGADWLPVREFGGVNDRVMGFQHYGGRLYAGAVLDASTAAVWVSTPIAVTLSGAEGSAGPETLRAEGLDLTISDTSADCTTHPTPPCAANNQVRFTAMDRAGNRMQAGPFAVLVDVTLEQPTAAYPAPGEYVRTARPSFVWVETSTMAKHEVEVSSQPAFSPLSVSTVTYSQYAFIYQSLEHDTTYYWRARAFSVLDIASEWSTENSFVVDLASPAPSGFQSVNSTGGAAAESVFIGLHQGVTVQLLVQDPVSGLSLAGATQLAREGVWHFDESTGTWALNTATDAWHASLTDEGLRGMGAVGAGLVFDGTMARYADIPAISAPWDGLTAAAWVRHSTHAFSTHTVLASSQFALQAHAVDGRVSYSAEVTPGNGCFLKTPSSFRANVWTHVAFTMDPAANENRIFVNGQEAASCSPASTPADSAFRVGEDGISGLGVLGSFMGGIDEVRIFASALDEAALSLERDQHQYYVRYSTDAGNRWSTVSSTVPAGGPYLSYSGTYGSAAQEMLQLENAELTESTSTAVCSGASPCGATNQVVFYIPDRAGNLEEAGPYAVIVDTSVPRPYLSYLSALSTTSVRLVVGSTDNLSGLGAYQFEASTASDFTGSISSTGYLSSSSHTFEGLLTATTYYFRVRARDNLLNVSTPSVVVATSTFGTVFYSTAAAVPASALQEAFVPMLRFHLYTPAGTSKFNGITVRRGGSSGDQDVYRAHIFQDADNDGVFDIGNDTPLEYGTFVSSAAIISFSSPRNLSVQKSTYFVVFEMSPEATVGLTVGATISVSGDILLQHPHNAEGTFPTLTSEIPIADGVNDLRVTPSTAAAGFATGAQRSAVHFPVLELSMDTDKGTSKLDQIVFRMMGTLPDTHLLNLKLWYDADGDGAFDDSKDQQVSDGNDSFVNRVATMNLTGALPPPRTEHTVKPIGRRYFVTTDIAGIAEQGKSFQIYVASTSDVATENTLDTVLFTAEPVESSTITIVIPNRVLVSPVDLVPADFYQGDRYAVLAASMTVDVGQANVNRMKVGRWGTAQNSDVKGVEIWLDRNQDQVWGEAVDDPPLGTGTFGPTGEADIAITTTTLTDSATSVVFVVYEIDSGAQPGRELGVNMIDGAIELVEPDAGVLTSYPIITSTGAIRATVNQLLVSAWSSKAPASVEQSQQDVPMLQLDVLSDNNDFNWLGLTLERLGTGEDDDISAVKVYKDSGTLGAFDSSDVVVGQDVFTGAGLASISLSPTQSVSPSTQTYFVAMSVAPDAVPGTSLGLRVADASAFNLQSPNAVSASVSFPMANPSPPVITQYPNTVTVSTKNIVDPLGVDQGDKNIGTLKLELKTDVSDASWYTLTLDQIGSAVDSDIDAVKVYWAHTGLDDWDASDLGNYTLVSTNTQTFGDAGAKKVAIDFALGASSYPTISPTTKKFYVVVDISTDAVPGRTVIVKAEGASYFTVGPPPNSVDAGLATFQSQPLSINPPPQQMYVVGLDSAPPQLLQTDKDVVMLTLKTWMTDYTGNWIRLNVGMTGSALDTDIQTLKLYRDANANGTLEPLSDQQLSTASFSGGTALLDFSALSSTVTTSTATYFLACDVSLTAVEGNTAGLRILNSGLFELTLPNSAANSGFPVQSSIVPLQAAQTSLIPSSLERSPGILLQGTTNQILMELTLKTTYHALLWSGVTLRSTGTVSDSDIAAVHIWKDVDKDHALDAAVDQEITSGLNSFISSYSIVGLTQIQNIGTSPSIYLVTVDAAPLAVQDRTVKFVIESTASFEVSSPHLVAGQNFPLNSGEALTDKYPEQLVLALDDKMDVGIIQGSTSVVAGLVAQAGRNQVSWKQLRVAKTGTLSDSGVQSVQLWRDADASGDLGGADVLVGSAAFVTGQALMTFPAPETVTTSTAAYLVAFVLHPAATPGAIVGFTIPDATYVNVENPDTASNSGLPFSTSLGTVLNAQTPSKPAVTVDGPYSSSFESVHFTWQSSVVVGSIVRAYYAVGTSAGGTEALGWTEILPSQTDVSASGFPLFTGTTYYVSVKAESNAGQTSPVGTSIGILMDFTEPDPPTPIVSVGENTVLITWAPVSGGPSGILGYIVEYRTGAKPVWLNVKTGSAVSSLRTRTVPAGAVSVAAVTAADVIAGTSFQAVGLPAGTLYLRMRTVTTSGVVSDPSGETKIQLGALPKDGISEASNYPNPFDSRNQSTTFHFVLPSNADVSIKIYSVFGRLVKQLGHAGIAGSNEVEWDGSDESGKKLSKGMYIAVIKSGGAKEVLKVGVIH